MSLTQAQLQARDGRVTASFLPYLMAGDEGKILAKWQELVGDPAYEAEDLSRVWPVQFGSYIEPFALDWHETATGYPLTRRGEVVPHPARPWFCCTLDAYRASDSTVIDCKAVGPWRKLDDVRSLYLPQMVAQRACVGAKRAALLVVHGGQEPVEEPLDWPEEYEAEVWARVDAFWQCVLTLTPPVAMTPLAAAIRAERIFDMTGSNEWGDAAATWLADAPAAKRAATAEKALKGLVPADAKQAHGAGVQITRDRAGRLSLKEMKV